MDREKQLADDMLHEYEDKEAEMENKAVIDFLKTIKYLV